MSFETSILPLPVTPQNSETLSPITVLVQLTPETDPELNDVRPVSFSDYINDQSKVKATDKNRYILCACHGVVPHFSLSHPPYDKLKRSQHPTQTMYKQEILRRAPKQKLRKRKNDELILLLIEVASEVTDEDTAFILDSEEALRSILSENNKEREESTAASRGPNITNCDRLRFIEVVLSDKVKALYRMSQDCLTRMELENRNSVVRLCDFYDCASEEFNNAEFIPYSQCLPDLHEHFLSRLSYHWVTTL